MTADPRLVSSLTDKSASFASSSGNTVAFGRMLRLRASFRKSRASCLVVGDAADLALAPEQFVVIESRHLVEMDRVDRDHPALAQSRERRDHDLAGRREGDDAVQFLGRFFILMANPFRAQRFGKFAIGAATGDDVDIALPGLQDRNRETGGTAKAVETHSLARLDARHTEAAKTDDAGAEQGRDVDIVETGGQGKCEIGADERVFGVASVDAIAGEDRLIAEIFHVVAAVPAVAIDAAHPGNADARAGRELAGQQIGRGAFDDFADDLVAGDETR